MLAEEISGRSFLTYFFFFQAEDGIRDVAVTGVQTCALPISVTSTGARTSTSVEAVGMTSFSDFAVGDIQTYTLDVTTVGNGSVSKNPDQTAYETGTSVVLTATPLPGHAFVVWGGDASGSTQPPTLAMNT